VSPGQCITQAMSDLSEFMSRQLKQMIQIYIEIVLEI